jgi:hypothetical protein
MSNIDGKVVHAFRVYGGLEMNQLSAELSGIFNNIISSADQSQLFTYIVEDAKN